MAKKDINKGIVLGVDKERSMATIMQESQKIMSQVIDALSEVTKKLEIDIDFSDMNKGLSNTNTNLDEMLEKIKAISNSQPTGNKTGGATTPESNATSKELEETYKRIIKDKEKLKDIEGDLFRAKKNNNDKLIEFHGKELAEINKKIKLEEKKLGTDNWIPSYQKKIEAIDLQIQRQKELNKIELSQSKQNDKEKNREIAYKELNKLLNDQYKIKKEIQSIGNKDVPESLKEEEKLINRQVKKQEKYIENSKLTLKAKEQEISLLKEKNELLLKEDLETQNIKKRELEQKKLIDLIKEENKLKVSVAKNPESLSNKKELSDIQNKIQLQEQSIKLNKYETSELTEQTSKLREIGRIKEEETIIDRQKSEYLSKIQKIQTELCHLIRNEHGELQRYNKATETGKEIREKILNNIREEIKLNSQKLRDLGIEDAEIKKIIEGQRKKYELQRQAKSNTDEEKNAYKEANKLLGEIYSSKTKLVKAGENESEELRKSISYKEIRLRQYLEMIKDQELLNKLTEREITLSDRLEASKENYSNAMKNVKDSISAIDVAIGHLLASGIMEIGQKIKQGFGFTTELNKSLTDIGMVTNQNQQETDRLGQSYNKLAKELGGTTQAVANASVEFYRQGLSQSEVNERIQQTVKFSKVAGMEFTQSAETLTAVVNSMGVDITRVTDVFAYMGDAVATSAEEIGIAFQKVGGIAGTLKVPFEKVASYIAVLSSKTRETSEVIGTAVRSMMMRFQQIKEKGFSEEDGTKINQVAKALSEVGISILDSTGQFKEFSGVMDELGGKWQGLDSKTKAYLSTMMAGTMQGSRFMALMDSYGDTVSLYEESLDSAGTTQQKFDIYLQSTEAYMNRLKTTSEGVWMTLYDGDVVRGAISGLTNLLDVLQWSLDTFGSVPTVLGLVGTALGMTRKEFQMFSIDVSKLATGETPKLELSLNKLGEEFAETQKKQKELSDSSKELDGAMSKSSSSASENSQSKNKVASASKVAETNIKSETNAVNTNTTATNTSKVANDGLGVSFTTLGMKAIFAQGKMIALQLATKVLNGIVGGLVGLVVGGLISAFTSWIGKSEEARQKNKELADSYNDFMSSCKQTSGMLDEIGGRYDELRTKTSLTREEKKEFLDIQQKIAEKYPELIRQYDAEGNAIIDTTKSVAELNKKLEENIRLKNQEIASGYKDAQKDAKDEVDKLKSEIRRLEIENDVDGVNGGNDKRNNDNVKQAIANLSKKAKLTKEEANQLKNLRKMDSDYTMQLNKRNREMAIAKGKINEINKSFTSYALAMRNVVKDTLRLNDSQDKTLESLIKLSGGIELTEDNIYALGQVIKEGNLQEEIEKIQNIKLDGSEESMENLENTVKGLITKIKDLTGVDLDYEQVLALVTSGVLGNEVATKGLIVTQKDLENQTMALKKKMEGLTDTFFDETDKLSDLNAALVEMDNRHCMSLATLKNLAKIYPDILNHLGSEKDLRDFITQAIEQQENVQAEAYYNMMSNSEKFLNENMGAFSSYFRQLEEMYGVDLSSCKSLAEAKAKIDEALIQSLLGAWSKYYNATAEAGSQINYGALAEDMQMVDPVTGQVKMNHAMSNAMNKLQDKVNKFKQASVDISRKLGSISIKVGMGAVDGITMNKAGIQNDKNIKDDKFHDSLNKPEKEKKEKEPTEYTSKAETLSKYLAKLEKLTQEWQKQAEAISDVNNEINHHLSLGTDEGVQRAIELQNKKYKEQEKLLNLLNRNKTEMEGMTKSIKDDFKNMFGLEINPDWTEAEFKEQMNKLFPDMTTTDEEKYKKYEEDKNKFANLVNDYLTVQEQLKSIKDGILGSQSDMMNTIKDAYNLYFQQIEKTFDKINKEQSKLNKEMSLLEGHNYKGKEDVARKLIDNAKEYAKSISDTILELENKQSGLEKNSAEWQIINDKIDEYKDKLLDANLTIKDQKDLLESIKLEEYNNVSSMLDKIVDYLKREHEETLKEQQESLNNTLEKDIEQKEKQVEKLREEIKFLQDTTKEDRENLAELKRLKDLYSKEDTQEAKRKVRELEKQIKELEKQQIIKDKEAEIEAIEKEKERLEKENQDKLDALDKDYEGLLSDRELYEQALKILQEKSQDEILQMLTKYDEKYQAIGESLGGAFSNAMLKELEKVKNSLIALQSDLESTVKETTDKMKNITQPNFKKEKEPQQARSSDLSDFNVDSEDYKKMYGMEYEGTQEQKMRFITEFENGDMGNFKIEKMGLKAPHVNELLNPIALKTPSISGDTNNNNSNIDTLMRNNITINNNSNNKWDIDTSMRRLEETLRRQILVSGQKLRIR